MRLNQILFPLSQDPAFYAQLDVIAAMGGRAAGAARYFSTAEQSLAALDPADPVWFVPVGMVVPDRVVGIDARPEHLGAGAMPMLERFGRGQLIATALSPADHLRLHMAQAARRLELGGDRALFAEERTMVEGILGRPLWSPGALKGRTEVFSWLWSEGDRAPYTASMIRDEDDDEANREPLREALERSPSCAFLAYIAGANALALGDFDAHAEYVARAFRCPLWTRFQVRAADIAIDLELAQSTRPDLVDPRMAKLLTTLTPEPWEAAARAAKGLDAARLAVDAAHLSGFDDRLADSLLRPIFTALGWGPALRLLDYRQGRLA